jgi:hypothetical protein
MISIDVKNVAVLLMGFFITFHILKNRVMKIGIMQPYFFPYLGYFSLIKHTDCFILLDEVQYIRHGWIERNRILKPNNGWQYIQVPLQKYHIDTSIKDISINNSLDWQKKILAQLVHYKKTAPYYYRTIDLLERIFNDKYDDITSLNKKILHEIIILLGFHRKIDIFSAMGLSITTPEAPDEWALNICKALENIDEYWNPPKGKTLFDESKYIKAGIKLKFQSINLAPYKQFRPVFEAGLSMVDILMFNDINDINKMLDSYEFI